MTELKHFSTILHINCTRSIKNWKDKLRSYLFICAKQGHLFGTEYHYEKIIINYNSMQEKQLLINSMFSYFNKKFSDWEVEILS